MNISTAETTQTNVIFKQTSRCHEKLMCSYCHLAQSNALNQLNR